MFLFFPLLFLINPTHRSDSADLRRVWIHRAVSGAGTDKGLLIDCLLATSLAEIKEVKEEWKDKFFIPIIARLAIDGVLLGGVHDLLEHSLAEHKPASGIAHDKVASDLDALYKAGEGKIGTDEKAITKIFAYRSREHLMFLDGEYKTKSPKKKSLSEVIMAETSGDLELALLASMSPLSDYHARRLHDSMKGLGTDEDKLICHVFLPEAQLLREVAASFKRLYNKNLVDAVASEVSGQVKEMLLAYINFHTK